MLFLFVSELSLTYNFYHKQGYLKHLLRNKTVLFFVLALISVVVGNLLKTVILGIQLDWNVTLPTEFNWYVYEKIVLYLAFYLLYSIISAPYYREIFMAVITVGICLITIYFYRYGTWSGWTKAYYISSLSFLFEFLWESITTKLRRCFVNMV